MKHKIKRRELEKIFVKHYNCYQNIKGFHASKRLLLFYAVECGLKCLLLKNINKDTTDDLFQYRPYEKLNSHGHDIRLMLKLVGNPMDIPRIEGTDQRFIEPADYNQMWRYGIVVKDTVLENALENKLDSIAKWIEERI